MTGDEILHAFARAAVLVRRRILRSPRVRRRHALRVLRKVTGR